MAYEYFRSFFVKEPRNSETVSDKKRYIPSCLYRSTRHTSEARTLGKKNESRHLSAVEGVMGLLLLRRSIANRTKRHTKEESVATHGQQDETTTLKKKAYPPFQASSPRLRLLRPVEAPNSL